MFAKYTDILNTQKGIKKIQHFAYICIRSLNLSLKYTYIPYMYMNMNNDLA